MDDFGSILKFEHPKWKASLVENLTVLFQAGELCDLYILCKDQKDLNVTYPCHACILASASPVVRNVLLKNDVFGSWTKMALESVGISAREWRYILRYVYTGSVSIQEPHIYAVWKAALFLQIEILVTVLATCIHKYHTKEMELNSPVPELKVCPCNISSMGSVFVKSHSQSMHNNPSTDHTMIQFFPQSIDRRDKDQERATKMFVSNEDSNRKRPVDVKGSSSTHQQTGVIDLTQMSPCKSEMQYSPEIPQECSSRKKRKMYTPRKVEAKQKGSEESNNPHGSILASVLESPLDNSQTFNTQRASSGGYGTPEGGYFKQGQLLHTLMTQRHGEGNQDPIYKGQLKSHQGERMQQKTSHSGIHNDIHSKISGVMHQRTVHVNEMKMFENQIQGRCVVNKPGNMDENKIKEEIHAPSKSKYTVANPLVIEPLTSEEQPVMNLSLRERLTSDNRTLTRERHGFDRPSQCTVTSTYARDKPLLSNLLRESSEFRNPRNESNENIYQLETPSSSVLKSLLVSNDNPYRSPSKNNPQRPEVEKKFPQFHDSSDDEAIFYSQVIDNDKSDPDYNPKKGKLQRKRSLSTGKGEKCPVRQKSQNYSSSTLKSTIEPYSASSILLSMIRDAETKKMGHGTAMESSKTVNVKHESTTLSNKVILQQPDIRQKSESETKGILRNLLNHRNGKSSDVSSKDSESLLKSTDKHVESVLKPPQLLKIPTPAQESLPFSHVLKNLASVYSSQDAASTALTTAETVSSGVSASHQTSPVYAKHSESEGEANSLSIADVRSEPVGKESNDIEDLHEAEDDHVGNVGNMIEAVNMNIENFLNYEHNVQSVKSKQNWTQRDGNQMNRTERCSTASSSTQSLKLTICKQGQDFKVKEEVLSPECQEIHFESGDSPENSLASDQGNIMENTNDSFSTNKTFECEKKDISRSTSDQSISVTDVVSENRSDSEQSDADEKDVLYLKGTTESSPINNSITISDSHDYSDQVVDSSQEKDSQSCDNYDSEKEKSDSDVESIPQNDAQHAKSASGDTVNFTLQSPSQDEESQNSCLEPSSPESHTLKINSYYSIAEPPTDGGYTIVEDGRRSEGTGLTHFRSLFEKDCASSVSESCSDTEVALN